MKSLFCRSFSVLAVFVIWLSLATGNVIATENFSETENVIGNEVSIIAEDLLPEEEINQGAAEVVIDTCAEVDGEQMLPANGLVDDTDQIINKLGEIRRNTYPDGINWDPSDQGYPKGQAWSCFGFAKKIQELLFGNIPHIGSNYSSAGANLTLVAETTDKSAGSIRQLLSKAQPGDWIQGAPPNQHSMIFCWQGGDKFAIYDANGIGGYNIVSMRELTYGVWSGKSWSKVSVYRNTAYPKKEATPKDTTPPVINRVWLDNQSGTGRMLYIEVSDNVDVSQVWCPTKAPGETKFFEKFATRDPGTNIWRCAIMGEDHSSKQGEYFTEIYAYDLERNQVGKTVTYILDWEKPIITNVKVKNISTLGYTVECTVSDNVGIDRVQFPTWLVNKTKPMSDWPTNTCYTGTMQGNTVTYTVRDSDYNHVKGDYATHIYAYDKAGNEIKSEAPVTLVKNEGKIVKESTFNGSRYLLLNDALYWSEAKKAAENMGGHLVTITSSDEQKTVQNLISGAGRPGYFIGGTDEGSEGSFQWVTGEPMAYTNWHSDNPDNWDGNENYMEMLSSGLWNDIPGNFPRGYVVEINTDTPNETDPIKLEYFLADKASNQTVGTRIGLVANTSGGTAPYQYKFYAKVGDETTVLSDYSTSATAVFAPDSAGSYTLFVDVKDDTGTTATKTIDNFIIVSPQPEEPEAPDDNTDDTDNTDVTCTYQTHVQNVGWQDWKNNGDMSGTSGKGLRLEGIRIKTNTSELGLSYATHVQNIGWQDPVAAGVMSGTSGLGLRLEAIRINLTGAKATQYDIYYRVHAQNVGWLDWAVNGADSGTAGFGYRLEGIEIKVLPKGSAAPGNTTKPFVSQ